MRNGILFAAVGVALILASPAFAQKPGSKGNASAVPAEGAPPGGTALIRERDRMIIRNYFGRQFAAGNCPPGLAKKNNGCMPPGQAKNWSRGQPLGSGVGFVPLPADLLAQITTPVGYQFVRVLNDVLLIAHGSRTVVDAVADMR